MLQKIAMRLGVTLDADTRENVANEQVRMVWSHAAIAAIVASAFAVFAAAHLVDVVGVRQVQFWIALKLIVVAPRLVLSQVYRRRGFPSGRNWRLRTYALLAADGLVWGLAGAWTVGLDINTASLVTASLCCVACVATFGMQVSKIATAAYVVPIIVQMVAAMLRRGDAFGFYGGLGLALFLVQVLITAQRSDAKLSEVFLLRIQTTRISAERQQALDLAQRQSAAKSQFLGTVSHELRTPVHGMLGIARLVHVETADPSVKKRMELIETSGTHLLRLVTDLIDVSRTESGQMKMQRLVFDLRSEIDRISDIYSVRAAEKGLVFTLDSRIETARWFAGDPVRIRQVLHNLLGNAIKFTQKGWIHLMVSEGPGIGEVHFAVRDTGVGINDEDQKIVFDAFQQVGPQTRSRRQGTGLGLTIAYEIARLLGGGITLKSRPDFGSVFDFWVKLEPVEEPPAYEAPSEQLPDDGIDACARILLVEDNDVNALIASSMLANQGHQVERVSDGAEAVRRALRESDRPDLILMDCMMPGMDGFDATRSIRAQEEAMGLARIPIIALSAIIDEETSRQSLAAGMDDALGKPFTNEGLRDVIRPWLALHQSVRHGVFDTLEGQSRSIDRDHSG